VWIFQTVCYILVLPVLSSRNSVLIRPPTVCQFVALKNSENKELTNEKTIKSKKSNSMKIQIMGAKIDLDLGDESKSNWVQVIFFCL
jgi:hypothetical protein